MENTYTGLYVGLKHWARKDYNGSRNVRNIYKVIRETEKAVYVCPADTDYGVDYYYCFWSAKSAITNKSLPNGDGIDWA